jgi:A/G-specific adenine glycosylase
LAEIPRKLLRWWRTHRRDLPWRRARSPYRVWVAEMMLQQTQVATVIDYYRRWLKAFPSFRSLAAASLDEVLKCWEGLGYYQRARNMHATARIVSADNGGRLPRTVDGLRELPGIGPYSAAAIASIGFGVDAATLDGNIIRVFCRLFAIEDDPKAPPVRKRLWSLAGELLPTGKAGDFNEALMDLGATVCTPSSPDCGRCPLRNNCQALRKGCQDRLPFKRPTTRTPHHDVAVGVVIKNGRVLIDRRKETGLLGGLWEFPGGKMQPDETPADTVRRELAEEVGVEVAPAAKPFITVKHAYSHFRITLRAVVCRHLSGRARAIDCSAVRWVGMDELSDYAFPRANQKVLAALLKLDPDDL